MSRNHSRGEITHKAYKALKEFIQSGDLKPGTRVRETDIANRLSISRTPVRDAILRLESEGMISFVPRYGVVVSELSHQETMELYDLREILESAAAQSAARHASVAEINELGEIISSESISSSDFNQIAALNRIFHAALYRSAHNRFLERSLLGLRDYIGLLNGTSLSVTGRQEEAHKEHLVIVEAIAQHNAKDAGEAARIHIRNAQQARLRLMRNNQLTE